MIDMIDIIAVSITRDREELEKSNYSKLRKFPKIGHRWTDGSGFFIRTRGES